MTNKKKFTKGKLIYLSLQNCRDLRFFGRKYPNRKTGNPRSYNKSVSLLFEILSPGFIMADTVKNKILALEEKNDENNCDDD